MSTWSSFDLDTIAGTDELHLSGTRPDGSRSAPVTIWAVVVDGHVYVRSVRGERGGWFKSATATDAGHIDIGGVDRDVSVSAVTDPALQDRISAAYRDKYARYPRPYVDATLTPQALRATLRLDPR